MAPTFKTLDEVIKEVSKIDQYWPETPAIEIGNVP